MTNERPTLEPTEGPDPTLEDPAMRALADGPLAPVRLKHPSGLWVLFITEMWERFSYYGMRALLVLYLIAGTAEVLENGAPNTNPGFGWSEENAYVLYGVYTFMVYLTAIFGGVLADRFLGTHRSMLVGGWIIACGHITLACTEFFGVTPGTVVSFQNSPGAVVCFLSGLAMIIVGTGFFKPCVSVMVGQLYGQNDGRRDSGFTIFYMGINLGAFMSPLIAGTLGEKVGWHWGFGSAAVGMIAGLIFYQIYRPKHLHGIGVPPENRSWSGRSLLVFLAIGGGIVAIPLVPLILFISGGLGPIVDAWGNLTNTPAKQTVAWIVGAGVLVGGILAFLFAQRPKERAPLGVIFILAFLGNIFFWTAFEQAGSSMNVFAQQNTDRTAWGLLKSDDLSQSVHIEREASDGGAFRLAHLGQHSADIVVGTSTAQDIADAISALSAFSGFETEVETTNDGDVGVAIMPGDVVTLTFDGAFPTFFPDAIEAGATLDSPLGAAAPTSGADLSSNVTLGVIEDTGFPATWYQSVNALCILICAPMFAMLWIRLERRNRNPSTPMKFALGLWILGLSFLAMVLGAMDARDGLAAPHWLLITYIVYTWGELCLSPVGLSMVTKLAPPRLQSFMMGVWFFTFALSNLCGGLVAQLSTKFKSEGNEPPEMTFVIEGLPGFYLLLVVFPIGMGVLILLLTPLLKKMMHGVK